MQLQMHLQNQQENNYKYAGLSIFTKSASGLLNKPKGNSLNKLLEESHSKMPCLEVIYLTTTQIIIDYKIIMHD